MYDKGVNEIALIIKDLNCQLKLLFRTIEALMDEKFRQIFYEYNSQGTLSRIKGGIILKFGYSGN